MKSGHRRACSASAAARALLSPTSSSHPAPSVDDEEEEGNTTDGPSTMVSLRAGRPWIAVPLFSFRHLGNYALQPRGPQNHQHWPISLIYLYQAPPTERRERMWPEVSAWKSNTRSAGSGDSSSHWGRRILRHPGKKGWNIVIV